MAATLIALSVAIVAIIGTLGARTLVASSPPAPGDAPALATATPAPEPGRSGDGQRRRSPADQPPLDQPPGGQGDAPGEGRPGGRLPRAGSPREEALRATDGAVPDGVTVFDDDFPAVTKLDPGLLAALRRAATAAAADGVSFVVNSGWRSPAYQDQLLREAVAEYGSEEEAARWVATAETSAHVSGEAVDLGPDLALAWLAEHGAGYGLCQTYANEPWHYELRPGAVDNGCPPLYADPTADPRMQP